MVTSLELFVIVPSRACDIRVTAGGDEGEGKATLHSMHQPKGDRCTFSSSALVRTALWSKPATREAKHLRKDVDI